MATIDLSRSATDYRKHYKSVRAQQGRVFYEDDHNENERIHGEETRAELVEIVGPVGAPGNGFLISNPRLNGGKIDFDLAAGALYLGGYRLTLDAPTTFQTQPDWLQIFGSGLLDPPAAARNDLVVVETYQVPVASVEDSETFDVALGGPDTAMRMRQLQRISILPGFAGTDCKVGWSSLAASLTAARRGTLNASNELVPDTQLQVKFANNGPGTDLCSPPMAGGYLGAENQAIRVQLVDQATLTWGFDNGGPLYRVKVDVVGGALTQVTLLTEPKDQVHWPTAQQVVEFLPWSAVLPNNEKTSEIAGYLTRVASSYDPDTQQFTIDPLNPIPAAFGVDWKQRADAGALAPTPDDVFFYMRVWNRGNDTLSPPAIPFVAGNPVDLTGTGLQVVITGNDRPVSDFWIIAARPNSPDLVVPWSLEVNKGPNGYRHFLAPLGVIQWTVAGGAVAGTIIDDCRPPFLPLTRIRSCCTVTVGDGETSFGKFSSIQSAIDSLPLSGGEVCILPGTYTENINIGGLSHIVIHGCCAQTVLEPKDTTKPVINIQDSQFITVKDLTVATDMSVGVLIASSVAGIRKNNSADNIVIRHVHFDVRDASAIACYSATNLTIAENDIEVAALTAALTNVSGAGASAAVYVFGTNVVIERNRIVTDSQDRLSTALGGIQLFGFTTQARIEHNHIEGGNGNGITLGAVLWVDSNVDPATGLGNGSQWQAGRGAWIDNNGCIHWGGGGPPPNGGDGNPQVPVAWALLFDIRILDNDILSMGASGIGSPDLPAGTQGIPIVEFLEITHNRITACAQIGRGQAAGGAALTGIGGIAVDVAGFATLRDNWIALNGTSFAPSICGVWFGLTGGLIIERNEILDNGPRGQTPQAFEAGPRGGIRVEFAGPPLTLNPNQGVDIHETEFPALRVCDNVVVAPSGQALAALTQGAVVIDNNELTSGTANLTGGPPTTIIDLLADIFGGWAVLIFNVGTLSESSSTDVNFSNAGSHVNGGVASSASGSAATNTPFVSGDILFNSNRVLLNFPDTAEIPITSSVLLFGFADVGVESNQMTARTGNHTLMTNALVAGGSVRFEGNRCQDRFDAGLSAFTFALMNATTNNQGTRCFLALALPNLIVDTGNKSWFDVASPGVCARLIKIIAANYIAAGFRTGG